jgi:hypothetical protein
MKTANNIKSIMGLMVFTNNLEIRIHMHAPIWRFLRVR